MRQLTVAVNKSQIDLFRRKARNSSVEILAHLYGTYSLTRVQVEHFLYPPILFASPTCVQATDIKREHKKFRFIGTIHSHPNCLPILSQADWEGGFLDGEVICGVCEVSTRKTRVVWWSPYTPLSCDWVYIPKQRKVKTTK